MEEEEEEEEEVGEKSPREATLSANAIVTGEGLRPCKAGARRSGMAFTTGNDPTAAAAGVAPPISPPSVEDMPQSVTQAVERSGRVTPTAAHTSLVGLVANEAGQSNTTKCFPVVGSYLATHATTHLPSLVGGLPAHPFPPSPITTPPSPCPLAPGANAPWGTSPPIPLSANSLASSPEGFLAPFAAPACLVVGEAAAAGGGDEGDSNGPFT